MNDTAFILTLAAAVGAAVPIALAALGELLAEKSGVLNLGVEGMMLIGAVMAFQIGDSSGSLWLALIGGSLACSLASGTQIAELAAQRGRIVEAGYQRRYDLAWEEIRRLVHSGVLGAPIMAVSMALWSPDPERWYYDQAASGGMPITHRATAT